MHILEISISSEITGKKYYFTKKKERYHIFLKEKKKKYLTFHQESLSVSFISRSQQTSLFRREKPNTPAEVCKNYFNEVTKCITTSLCITPSVPNADEIPRYFLQKLSATYNKYPNTDSRRSPHART